MGRARSCHEKVPVKLKTYVAAIPNTTPMNMSANASNGEAPPNACLDGNVSKSPNAMAPSRTTYIKERCQERLRKWSITARSNAIAKHAIRASLTKAGIYAT